MDFFDPSSGNSHLNQEATMERRTFLGAVTGVPLGLLLDSPFAESAQSHNDTQAGQSPFETSQVEVSGNTVFVRRYGKGP